MSFYVSYPKENVNSIVTKRFFSFAESDMVI